MNTKLLPATIADESALEELLSEPSAAAVRAFEAVAGDVMILGAGGKMGPSLARMARRIADQVGTLRRVIAVSRFTNSAAQQQLHNCGVETIRGDLLDAQFVNGLPDVPNVINMSGMKFGTSQGPAMTWATNVVVPTRICEKFRESRLVTFSTGNVYPLVPVAGGGSLETDRCEPVGEYAMAALGRERVFHYFSESFGIPMAIIRLNYAVEMRYGVLVDIAQKIWRDEPLDVTMGHANVIWQGDANAFALATLSSTAVPPFVINVTGPECISIREVAKRFGELMHKQPALTGQEAATALLSNAQRAIGMFGASRVNLNQLIQWIADWTMRGGVLLGKPTHFEVRDGKF